MSLNYSYNDVTQFGRPQKARLKLGKGKKPASNAVDTSFKAHCKNNNRSTQRWLKNPPAIALPSQSITADKTQAGPSTKRKQTLPELLSLLRHYSAGTRKGASCIAFRNASHRFACRCASWLAWTIFNSRRLDELLDFNSCICIVQIDQRRGSFLPKFRMILKLGPKDGSVRKMAVGFQDWYLHKVSKVRKGDLFFYQTIHAMTGQRAPSCTDSDATCDICTKSYLSGNKGRFHKAYWRFLGCLSWSCDFGGDEWPCQ